MRLSLEVWVHPIGIDYPQWMVITHLVAVPELIYRGRERTTTERVITAMNHWNFSSWLCFDWQFFKCLTISSKHKGDWKEWISERKRERRNSKREGDKGINVGRGNSIINFCEQYLNLLMEHRAGISSHQPLLIRFPLTSHTTNGHGPVCVCVCLCVRV